MQRVGHVLHAAGAAPLVIDAPPDTKGADAADWARLTDRRTGACDRAAEGEEETAVRRLPRGAGDGTRLVLPHHVLRRARLVLPFE